MKGKMKMEEFEKFSKKLGKNYRQGFKSVCTDKAYNLEKTLKQGISEDQFIQAATEQMYYYWLKKKNEGITSHDKRVNAGNKKDVDICYDGSPYNLRIEVKTPVIDDIYSPKDQSVLHGIMDHKYDVLPRDVSPSYASFAETFNYLNGLINATTSQHGKTAITENLKDLKLKDYLSSANEKMIDSDNQTINILLVGLNTELLGSFSDYILNPYTGLFSQTPYIQSEVFQKIDFIVLSNCCEAHMDSHFGFNPWDADNYVHFAIPNLNKKGDVKKEDYIALLFNDKVATFFAIKDKVYSQWMGVYP